MYQKHVKSVFNHFSNFDRLKKIDKRRDMQKDKYVIFGFADRKLDSTEIHMVHFADKPISNFNQHLK